MSDEQAVSTIPPAAAALSSTAPASLPVRAGCAGLSQGTPGPSKQKTSTYVLHSYAPAPSTSPCRKQPCSTVWFHSQPLPCPDHAVCAVVLPAWLVLTGWQSRAVLCPAGLWSCR